MPPSRQGREAKVGPMAVFRESGAESYEDAQAEGLLNIP